MRAFRCQNQNLKKCEEKNIKKKKIEVMLQLTRVHRINISLLILIFVLVCNPLLFQNNMVRTCWMNDKFKSYTS